jgi:hypothetical protein
VLTSTVRDPILCEMLCPGGADLDVGAQNTCPDARLQGVVDALGHWKRTLGEYESKALGNDGRA